MRDKAADTLQVLAAHRERDAPAHVAEALAGELRRFAGWLGVGTVRTHPRGDLAADLLQSLG